MPAPATRLRRLRLAAVLAAALVAMPAAAGPANLRFPDTAFEAVSFAALPGWVEDDHAEAFATFLKSCRAVVRRHAPVRPAKPMLRGLRAVCARALEFPLGADGEAARRFFEENFRPWRITRIGEEAGFLTGYYEPEVEGSLEKTDAFATPLLARPADLVPKRRARGGFPSTGGAGLRKGRKLVEYHDRAAIEDGALAGRGLELVWLKDPIEAFFIHIQGSARVRLPDDRILRLNYAAHNGHGYTPVGRILIERGIVPREDMSLARIRAFIEENPAEGRELMRMNRSFVFFRVVDGLPPEQAALGGQGLPLTPGRSIAIDRAIHTYGTPFFIDAELPIQGDKTADPFRRLMIAQDTGSAIVGPARADLYFGTGPAMGAIAGRIRHPGRFTILVPREVDPREDAAPVPLPRPRPQ